jgi:hypothetical protein
MKSIITLQVLIVSTITLFCCRDSKKDDVVPNTPPPQPTEEQLPPITSTGAGTFGCKVNGKVWVAKSNKDYPNVYASVNKNTNWYLLITGAQIDQESQFDLINLRCYNVQTQRKHHLLMLDSNSSSASFVNSVENQFWNTNSFIGGELSLIRFDSAKQIVAGTFQFDCVNINTHDTLHITDGRFDMNFLY